MHNQIAHQDDKPTQPAITSRLGSRVNVLQRMVVNLHWTEAYRSLAAIRLKRMRLRSAAVTAPSVS